MYKNASLWAGGFFLLFSLLFFSASFGYSYQSRLGNGIGPGFLPFWLSLFMLIFSVLYLGYAITKERIDFSTVLPDKEGLKNTGLIFLYMIIFTAIVEYAGFVIATSLMLFLMFSGYLRWYYNVIVSLGTSVLLYWIFAILLSVPLPVSMFGW
ncbi:tripartite tricarboxylate transporter TctB family protein [Sporomusa termitida]|uniref:Tripartite tricarboxylate transporter TctB family protein n=1 Tax=Sporomusa termitida TaxID=2377 RepID=A0A517E1B1_9FIRM|nr:tripartite tricarboxylate transporter TctB family protein [Sporomusa termitida]QDR83392.1 Tripartite tricarboxylate transporter TctB family protein [Sporomusa termitida]